MLVGACGQTCSMGVVKPRVSLNGILQCHDEFANDQTAPAKGPAKAPSSQTPAEPHVRHQRGLSKLNEYNES